MCVLKAMGERLRQERVKKGLSQGEFAALAGASRNSQGQYESGKTPPTTEYLLNLQEHGVDIGFVVTGQRTTGELGYLEKHLLTLFRSIPYLQQEALLNFLDAMSGRPRLDLAPGPHVEDPVHRSVQSPGTDYRAPPAKEEK